MRPEQRAQAVKQQTADRLGRRAEGVEKREVGYPHVATHCRRTLAAEFGEVRRQIILRGDTTLFPALAPPET